VLAAGWRDFFVTADFIWTTQVLEAKIEGNDDDTVNAFTTAPRVGYRAGFTEVWMGARYIESDRRFSGSIDDFNYYLEVFEGIRTSQQQGDDADQRRRTPRQRDYGVLTRVTPPIGSVPSSHSG